MILAGYVEFVGGPRDGAVCRPVSWPPPRAIRVLVWNPCRVLPAAPAAALMVQKPPVHDYELREVGGQLAYVHRA